MAKITRLGGVSDKLEPDTEPQDAPVPAEAPAGPDTAAEPAEADTDAQGPAPEDADSEPEAEAALELVMPGVNALKTVWEEALIEAQVSAEWVYAEGRTKDALVTVGRGLADGSVHLDEGVPYDGHGVAFT
jgi:hypothetical protein